MTSENFFSVLRQAYAGALDVPFLEMPDGAVLTYHDIDDLSARIAARLGSLGAKPGDRITVQVEKSPENIALYLAALRAGLIYVPLNTAYTDDELAYFLSDSEPAIFVCAPDREAELAPLAKSSNIVHLLTLGAKGEGSLLDKLPKASGLEFVAEQKSDDIAVIIYTSGTTGRSKGAMLTHDNLQTNAETLTELWGMSSDDILIHALPVFHVHGLFIALHTAMLSASKILFFIKFDVAHVQNALSSSTLLMGVPTFYSRLLAEDSFGKQDCANMRLFISGSAPLTKEVFNEFHARTGMKILERYGMSEAGMIASNPLDGDRIAGTVGFALDGIEIEVADENGARLSANEPGEVLVRGPNIFKGYWRNEGKTAESFTEDGFFRTGDVGSLDESGRLTLAGREKDMIIAGGFNIYPVEIEQLLDALPDVMESAVIGVPHKDMGEGVVAVLVTGHAYNETDLDAAIEKLAKFKRPRKFFLVDELPRNAMGKVQKHLLREKYKDAFQN